MTGERSRYEIATLETFVAEAMAMAAETTFSLSACAGVSTIVMSGWALMVTARGPNPYDFNERIAMSKILIVGASGVVGAAALDRFLARDDFEVVAVSRRRPEIFSTREYHHLPVDLRDADSARGAFAAIDGVTHLVYTALFEKPGLIAGWRDTDQMRTNLSMLQNVMIPLLPKNELQHVSLLQGAKAYGTHFQAIPVPAKEEALRDPNESFYGLQEDYVREQSAKHGFGWTVLRPQLIVGGAVGVPMNLVPVIGAYAAICAELGMPFSYPGGASYVWEMVDSRICASALEWAAETDTARGQIFNVTNGDVFEWRHMWPTIADTLGVEAGPDAPRSMVEFLSQHRETWAKIAIRNGLRITDLNALVGESHHYADRSFAFGLDKPYDPRFLSTIKIRQAGYTDCLDSSDTCRFWLGALLERGYLPSSP